MPSTRWIDIRTLRLVDGKWIHAPAIASEEADELAALAPSQLGACGEHVERAVLTTLGSAWHIEIQPRRDIGCRSIFAVLDRLLDTHGASSWPRRLYLRASPHASAAANGRPPFRTRGLVALQGLCDRARRHSIWADCRVEVLPERPGEEPEQYQVRAVEFVARRVPGLEERKPKELLMPAVQSKPDGLYVAPDSSCCTIVEAKMRIASFEEGVAQVFQYAGQARHSARFSRARVTSWLVAKGRHKRLGLAEQWIAGDVDFECLVPLDDFQLGRSRARKRR